jgi:hypothetical protein
MIRFLSLFFFLLILVPAKGQQKAAALRQQAEQILKERGEVRLVFPRPPEKTLRELSRILSVDRVDRDSVWVYAGKKAYLEFLRKGIPYRLWLPSSASKGLMTASSLQEATRWDVYPTYPQYDSIMQAFAAAHPAICRLDTLGYSLQGRLLLAVKISDNVQQDEDEPEFFYTSTMHGDETGGYVMLLHLIDSLLTGYGQGGQIQRLVDSLEIWINPLANPDGTYHGGDNTVSNAVRFTADTIDLNRNYPDLVEGPHPDGNDYATENVAMMDFMQQHHFVMSANLHAGAEVVNYPWDSWNSSERTHADNDWFVMISREYADTVHAHAPAGYMTYLGNGVANGGDWYEISGGRQDYVTGFLHGREVTIELDDTKITPSGNLLSLWDYNKRSFLNYMEEAIWGLGGYVVDYTTRAPVPARIEVVGHDDGYSYTFTDSTTGYFRRPIAAGTWDLQVTAEGYDTLRLPGVSTQEHDLTWLVIRMGEPLSRYDQQNSAMKIWPNPAQTGERLHLLLPREDRYTVTLTSVTGRHIILFRDTPLQQGENTLRLPGCIKGLWLITVTGERTVPLIRKVIIRE